MMSDGDLLRIAVHLTVERAPCPLRGTERVHVATNGIMLCLTEKDLTVLRGLTDRGIRLMESEEE